VITLRQNGDDLLIAGNCQPVLPPKDLHRLGAIKIEKLLFKQSSKKIIRRDDSIHKKRVSNLAQED